MNARLLITPCLFGLATACSNMNIQQHYEEMRPSMLQNDWKTAAAQIEEAKKRGIYGEVDRVMYWLNYGTILHYAGEYQKSQEVFVQAEQAIQDLWTKSISAEASKFILNETVQSYPGEDFEKILIYLYTALNHVRQGRTQDALVEARRADEFLKKMQVEHEKEGGIGTLYKQDAFMLWLVGLFYEIEGSWNDATLAYKAAYEAYTNGYAGNFGVNAPSFLAEDVVRTAMMAGDGQTADEWKSKGGDGATSEKLKQGMAEIVLLHGSGESPRKIEYAVNATMQDGYVARVALPKFKKVPNQIAYAEVSVAGAQAKTEVLEPVSTIALKNFKKQQPGLTARAIARAVIKYAATKGSQKAVEGEGTDGNRKAAGALLGLAGNITAAATEAADLRSWTTLPSEIEVARLWVPPGSHTIELKFFNKSGSQVRTMSVPVEAKNGERKIVSVRTFE
jgi:uncharacterized protein